MKLRDRVLQFVDSMYISGVYIIAGILIALGVVSLALMYLTLTINKLAPLALPN